METLPGVLYEDEEQNFLVRLVAKKRSTKHFFNQVDGGKCVGTVLPAVCYMKV